MKRVSNLGIFEGHARRYGTRKRPQFSLNTQLPGGVIRANFHRNLRNRFLLSDDHAVIICPGPRRTSWLVKVDLCDIYRVLAFGFWRVADFHPKGNHRYAYVGRKNHGKTDTFYLHRVVMQAPDGLEVDHINHDTLNNRRSNIRVVSHAENMRNRKVSPVHSSSYAHAHPANNPAPVPKDAGAGIPTRRKP